MLTIKMGPQLMTEGIAPMSAPPTRVRHVSNSSTGSLPGGEIFQFPMISHFNDMPSTTTTSMFNGQQQHARLDRSVSESYAQNKQQLQPPTSQGKNVLNPSRYKTEVCRPFNENGFCKYGDKCQFAHGSQDMRGLPRHPKYKTELCRTFHTVGFCPYGPRCHFIHSEDERKLVEINAMKQQHAAQQAAREMAQLQAQQQALELQLKALVSQVQLTTQIVNPGMSGINDRPMFQHSISVHPRMPDNLGSSGESPTESTSGGSPVLSPVFTEDSVSDSNSDCLSSMLTPPVSADSSFSFPGGESLSPLNMSPARLPQQQQQQQQRSATMHFVTLENISNSSSNMAATLATSLQGLNLSNGNNTNVGESSVSSPVFSPPHSPDQLHQNQQQHHQHHQRSEESSSPITSPHGRLPIFTQLAQNS